MKILVGTLLGALCAQSLLALDFDADYPVLPPQPNGQGFYAGLAEQFTSFNDTQPHISIISPISGTKSPYNPYLNTLTSEPFLGYNFNERIGLQLELPVIYREYQIVAPGNAVTEFFRIHNSEYGMGDIGLRGNVALVRKDTTNCSIHWNATAGIKFPTGDSSQLSPVEPSTPLFAGAINRADVALGSGSYDGLVGTDILLRHDRFFLTAQTQYDIRSEGDFDYQFANDLSWYGGPGIYLLTRDDYSLSLQAIVSGDTKGKDTGVVFNPGTGQFFRGSLAGTSETGVYLGPQINFTWRDQLVAQLGADIPVSIETDGVQIVPSYRIHASATWRF